MAPPPDLSVVIASSGQQHDLQATLRSLALQTDVSCETVILDDAMGEVAAAQRAIENSRTTFITFVRSGDVLLPGALHALRDALVDAPQAGLVDALWLPLDAERQITRQAARSHVSRFRERLPPIRDRRSLAVGRKIALGLPTFRRETLRLCGRLAGASLDDALHEAVSRVVHRAEVRLVPQVLCATPRLGPHGGRRPWRTGVGDFASRWRGKARRATQRLATAARAAPLFGPLLRAPVWYEMFVALLQRWSFDGLRLERRPVPNGGRECIAYVLWRYPTLGDTFIRREVQALRGAGLSLEVFALESDDPPVAMDASSPSGAVTYFGPEQSGHGRALIRGALRRHPWTVVRLWLFVVRHPHRRHKTWWQDRDVLYLAGQLAAALAKHGITHVHSPWANHYAFLSFVASRLLGVSFSVQARASEIHRSVPSRVVVDRLQFAEFVVTNSRYNERYLRAQLCSAGAPPIQVVYNGVELSRFRPIGRVERGAGPFRILAVGRLVEPKGFRYLMHACRLLRDRRVDLSCEIIGGPVEPVDTMTWVELRMLQSELGLESAVHFRGAQPFSAVLAACHRADVFVLPCVRGQDGSHDITPNSLIEAMAMGLPVVSCTSGAIPEIVEHERDGLLVPPNDERALADAIERLMGDARLSSTLGAAARRKVEERFDIDRNVTQRVKLFRSLRAE